MSSIPVDTPEGVQSPENSSQTNDKGQDNSHTQSVSVTIEKIRELLKTKNDTSRFVGLALLKSVLDNSQQLREDEATIATLWQSVSPKFLDRLLRSDSKQNSSNKDAKDMIDIAVAVLHTFSLLLSDEAKKNSSLVGRIPALVVAILHSSEGTTQLILQTLLTLVSYPDGAKEFVAIEDVSPLVEIAPSHPLVLDVFLYAYAQSAPLVEDQPRLRSNIGKIVQSLIASFKGTDAVTLLSFLDQLLRRLDPENVPSSSSWLRPVTGFIRNLVTSKPTPASRAAYTNISASLLQTYPTETSRLLFSDGGQSDKPFSYLLINLILVDLRSSFPTLLGQLNSPEYESTSRRLASGFDVVSAFIGFLVRVLEDEDLEGPLSSLFMAPDLLLKLRSSISETLSLALEYLRDRWDAAEAGAMGLHPDARVGTANTSRGSRYTLAWDSKTDNASQDPLILAAIRALAIWLREEDNDTLRKEAAGLSDMLMDLYKISGTADARLDFRRPVLVALEGMITVDDGITCLLDNDGWNVLTQDMLAILQASSTHGDESESARGIEIVRVLLPIVEVESPGSRESWMNVVTAVSAWSGPADTGQPNVVYEFQVAVLQLATALASNTHPGMQRRYVHSFTAIMGIAEQLKGKVVGTRDEALIENLRDVEITLSALR
ncbi:hypothetical protein VP1G_06549 [Cytospora mali]|uniref:Uncharacterized protein n=1 Tax=Cytospora mali TaxID=578113 RepID=A0A194V5W3_CYTMA|nr:hypothetical protein VP1G_06549 [Valsa mali var. pyri (nom. inval.)]